MVTRKNSLESETQYDSKQIGKGFIHFFSKKTMASSKRQSEEKKK